MNTQERETLEIEHGLKIEELTPYQFRIDGDLDIYPTRRKWHDISMNTRGTYTDLVDFVVRHLACPVATTCPKCKHHFFATLKPL